MKTIKQFLTLVHADPAKEQELLHYLQTDDQANIIRMASSMGVSSQRINTTPSSMGVTLTPQELAYRIEPPSEPANQLSPETQAFDFWDYVKNLVQ